MSNTGIALIIHGHLTSPDGAQLHVLDCKFNLNNMGTTLTIENGYTYYNSTLNTTDWTIILEGFAAAAYTALDMPNATFWVSLHSHITTA